MKYYNANFHGDGLLDPDVREVRLFKKTTKARAKEFFLNLYKWLIFVLQKYFSNYVYLKDLCKHLKEIGISMFHTSLH